MVPGPSWDGGYVPPALHRGFVKTRKMKINYTKAFLPPLSQSWARAQLSKLSRLEPAPARALHPHKASVSRHNQYNRPVLTQVRDLLSPRGHISQKKESLIKKNWIHMGQYQEGNSHSLNSYGLGSDDSFSGLENRRWSRSISSPSSGSPS